MIEKDNAKDEGGFGYPLLYDGWRDCTKELPEPLTHCLIYYCEDWNYDQAWKIGFCFFNSAKEFCIENSKVKPTHWCPLPDPPTVI